MSSMMIQHNLMDILSAETAILSQCQLQKVYEIVTHNGNSSLFEGIIQSGLMSEETLLNVLSERLNIKKIDLADCERQIKALTSMIEPVMILVMGSIVGFIVVSMLMPIFKVSTLVH